MLSCGTGGVQRRRHRAERRQWVDGFSARYWPVNL